MVKSAQVAAGTFVTRDTTGALSAATTGPVGTLYVNGVANGASVTITGANPYKWAVTLPALTAGDCVSIYITATIATIATGSVVWEAVADTSRLSDIATTLGTPANIDTGGATIADNLKKLADDNGGLTFDATTNSLNKLTTTVVAGVGAAINAVSQTYTRDTSGSRAGDYSYTYLSNATYWTTAPTSLDGNGNGLDVHLTFMATATQTINSVTTRGYFQNATGSARYVTAWAWNYISNAWQQISDNANRMSHATTNQPYSWSLTSQHRKSDGEIQIRFTSTSATTGDRLNIDQCVVNVQTAGPSATDIANAVYAKMALVVYDRQVWIDTVSGTDGTTVGVHGLASSPVKTLTAAYALCADLGLKSIAFKSGSNGTGVELTQAATGWRFVGPAVIDLSGEDIEDAIFEDCYDIYGTSVGDDAQLTNCGLAGTGALTIDHAYFKYCRLKGEIILIANAEPHDFEYCTDATGTGAQAEITFVANATVLMRAFTGAIQLNDMAGTNDIVIDGATRVVIDASCTAGDVTVRGFASAIAGAAAFEDAPNDGHITQTARFATDNTIDADMIKISRDSVAADRLEAMLDATPFGIVVDDNDPDPSATAFETNLSMSSDGINNAFCVFATGALLGQSQKVGDWDNTSKVLTTAAFTTAPTAGDAFYIIGKSA